MRRRGPVAQPFSWEATAYSLLLDQMGADVLDDFTSQGIDALVLKGPTLASWLWPDDQRGYGDIDLLVGPADFAPAVLALSEMGFVEKLAPENRFEDSNARPFIRSDGLVVDLHRGIAGIEVDADESWEILREHRAVVELGGMRLPGLDMTARLVHVALHAAQHVREPKPRQDLERAVEIVDLDKWQQAVELSRRLKSHAAFATGLQVVPSGRSLARSLGLDERLSVDDTLRLRGAPSSSRGIERLSRSVGVAGKIRSAWSAAVPTESWLRQWTPIARRGRLGMVAARIWRIIFLIVTAPAGFLYWIRARRESRKRSDRSAP